MDNHVPERGEKRGVFQSTSKGEAEFLLEISNFSYFQGGFRNFITLGVADEIHRYASHQEQNEIFQFTSILIIGLLFFNIYQANKDFTALLFFSLLCIVNAVRILFRGHRLIHSLLFRLPWEIDVRIEFLLGYLVLPLFGMFLYQLGYVQKHVALKWIYFGVGFSLAGITLFAPHRIYALLLQPYVYGMIGSMPYFSYVLIQGIRKKQWDALAILAVSWFLLGGILYDYYVRGFTPLIPIAIYSLIIVLFLIVTNRIGKNHDQILTNEIAFLQAQIKPHFLINVLNSLAQLSESYPQRAEKLIEQLSIYLRNNFDFFNLEEFIPLGKELGTIDAYISIEKERFGDRIAFERVGEVRSERMIPPLLLQPLVENAVRHGISKRIEGGKVVLEVRETQKGMEFTVWDNGVGMNEETLRRVLSGEIKGVAIKNINARLRRNYGTKLHITSKVDAGTKICFMIPKRGRKAW